MTKHMSPKQGFDLFVDSKLQRWTVAARQTMLNSGEDAVVDLLAEIVEERANPTHAVKEQFKLDLAAIGFAHVFQSAFCQEDTP